MKFWGISGIVGLCVALAGCGPSDHDDGVAALARARKALAETPPDKAAAWAALRDCVAQNPTNFEAQLSLSQLALERGEPAVADCAAQAAVRIDPASAEACLADGAAAHLVKDYARARADFAAVAAARDLPRPIRSQALASRGVVELSAGEPDAARVSFWRALRLDFRNAAAWYHLGVLSRGTWHYDAAALDQFEMACRLDPNTLRTRNTLRTTIPSLRENLARTAAEKPGAAQRDPGKAAKLLSEGAAAEKKKDAKTALLRYAKAHEADPLSWEAAWSHAQALAASEKGRANVDTVLAAYRDARDAKPASRETCLAAARFALDHRRVAVACDFLSFALAHFPDSKPVLDLYVTALGKLGTAEGAHRAKLYQAYRREL